MLISLHTAFQSRQECLIAFDFYNLESLLAVLEAARKSGKVVAAAFGEGYLSHMPLELAAALCREADRLYRIPFVLHLDHARDPKVIRKAMELGFTSVMYDGSRLPLEQNIQNTKEITALARGKGISVEGELGGLNPEDGTENDGTPSRPDLFTDAGQARQYVDGTGVDALAVSVGNVHGLYRGIPHIDLDRVRRIRESVGIPLALHGGSGIPDGVLRDAIRRGVRKININTELAVGAARAAEVVLYESGGGARMEKVMESAREAMERIALEKLSLFS